jgi:hypothetical protein
VTGNQWSGSTFGWAGFGGWGPAVTDENYEQKLAELDDLINDPNMPLCPSRIWQLMGEISGYVSQVNGADMERWPISRDSR